MAEATDILTLAEARTALRQGSTQTANDTVIAHLVTAVTEHLDGDDGIGPTVIRTVTGETHDGRGTCIRLAHRPVESITTITESSVAVDPSGWLLDAETGFVYRRNGDRDTCWESGRDNIVVTYEAGRVATTVGVSAHIKQGAILFLRHLWRAEQWNAEGITSADFEVPQVAYPSFSVPNAVKDWFGGQWRGTRGGFV